MSRSIRFAAALLILASLTCGSLGALPCGPRITPVDNPKGGLLANALEWVVSLLTPDRPTGQLHEPTPQPQTKDGSHMDPQGGGH